MGHPADGHRLYRYQGKDGRKHNPRHELEQQYALNHLRTALRPAMNMMTMIPTVIEIEIARARPSATAVSAISFPRPGVLRPNCVLKLSHRDRRERITRCSAFLLPREAWKYVPRLGKRLTVRQSVKTLDEAILEAMAAPSGSCEGKAIRLAEKPLT